MIADPTDSDAEPPAAACSERMLLPRSSARRLPVLLATLATAGALAPWMVGPSSASEDVRVGWLAQREADPIGAPGDVAFAVIQGYAPIAASLLWSPFAPDALGPLSLGIDGLREAMRGSGGAGGSGRAAGVPASASASNLAAPVASAADRLRVDPLERAAVPVPAVPQTPPVRLTTEQRRLVQHITRIYRVAPTAIESIVFHAYRTAAELRLEPSLLLAVMATESSFNPFAESKAGAQGLMQVLTRVHKDRFSAFGGVDAAWDPIANIRVGAGILAEYVQRYGDIASGLKAYVGAALLDHDFGYGSKVIARRDDFAAVARGETAARTADTKPARPSPTARNGYEDSRRVTASIGL